MIKDYLPRELVGLVFEFVNGEPKENNNKVLGSLTKVFKNYHEHLEYANKGFTSEEDRDYEMSLIPPPLELRRHTKKEFIDNKKFLMEDHKKDYMMVQWEFGALRDQMEDELEEYMDKLPYSTLLLSWIIKSGL